MRNFILVTHGGANNSLLVQPEMEQDLASEVFGILTFSHAVKAKINPITLKQFLSRILTPGEDAWAPIYEIMTPPEKPALPQSPKKTARIKQLAMFKGDKAVGFLNDLESEGFFIATGQPKEGGITVNLGSLDRVTFYFTNSKVKTSASIKDTKLQIDIDLRIKGELRESSPYPLTTPEGVKKIEGAINNKLKNQISSAVKKAQAKGSDIFGLGRVVQRKYPSYWEKIQGKWDTVLPQVSVNVNVKSQILHTGMRVKSYNNKIIRR